MIKQLATAKRRKLLYMTKKDSKRCADSKSRSHRQQAISAAYRSRLPRSLPTTKKSCHAVPLKSSWGSLGLRVETWLFRSLQDEEPCDVRMESRWFIRPVEAQRQIVKQSKHSISSMSLAVMTALSATAREECRHRGVHREQA